MVRLVKLQDAQSHRPVYVNAENIVWVEPISENETSIRFVGNQSLIVSGTPDDLVIAIGKTERGQL